MTRRRPDGRRDGAPARLPGDLDVDARAGALFAPVPRRRLPRVHGRLVAAVAVGGFAGGALRYAVGLWLPASPGSFPWAVFAVNTAGAFLLALLLVLVLEVLPPTTYLRPLVGTGFCGALTTFGSVTAGVDQLVEGSRAGTAVGYLAASVAGGVAAAVAGIVVGRAAAAARRR